MRKIISSRTPFYHRAREITSKDNLDNNRSDMKSIYANMSPEERKEYALWKSYYRVRGEVEDLYFANHIDWEHFRILTLTTKDYCDIKEFNNRLIKFRVKCSKSIYKESFKDYIIFRGLQLNGRYHAHIIFPNIDPKTKDAAYRAFLRTVWPHSNVISFGRARKSVEATIGYCIKHLRPDCDQYAPGIRRLSYSPTLKKPVKTVYEGASIAPNYDKSQETMYRWQKNSNNVTHKFKPDYEVPLVYEDPREKDIYKAWEDCKEYYVANQSSPQDEESAPIEGKLYDTEAFVDGQYIGVHEEEADAQYRDDWTSIVTPVQRPGKGLMGATCNPFYFMEHPEEMRDLTPEESLAYFKARLEFSEPTGENFWSVIETNPLPVVNIDTSYTILSPLRREEQYKGILTILGKVAARLNENMETLVAGQIYPYLIISRNYEYFEGVTNRDLELWGREMRMKEIGQTGVAFPELMPAIFCLYIMHISTTLKC